MGTLTIIPPMWFTELCVVYNCYIYVRIETLACVCMTGYDLVEYICSLDIK